MLYRCYLKNDGNVYRGIDPNEMLLDISKAKKENSQVWVDFESGLVVEIFFSQDKNSKKLQKIISVYHISKLPGDSSFKLIVFPDLETKSLDEILKEHQEKVEVIKEVKPEIKSEVKEVKPKKAKKKGEV